MSLLSCRNCPSSSSSSSRGFSTGTSICSSQGSSNGLLSDNILNGKLFSLSISFCLYEKINSSNDCSLRTICSRPKVKHEERQFSLFVSEDCSNNFNGGGGDGGDYYSCCMKIQTAQIGNLLLKQINLNANKIMKSKKVIRQQTRESSRPTRERQPPSLKRSQSRSQGSSQGSGQGRDKTGRQRQKIENRSLDKNTSTEKFCNKIRYRRNPYKTTVSSSSSETSAEDRAGTGSVARKKRGGRSKKSKSLTAKKNSTLKTEMKTLAIFTGNQEGEQIDGPFSLDGNRQQQRVVMSGTQGGDSGQNASVRVRVQARAQATSGTAGSAGSTVSAQYRSQATGSKSAQYHSQSSGSNSAQNRSQAMTRTRVQYQYKTGQSAQSSAGQSNQSEQNDPNVPQTVIKTLPDGRVVRIRYRVAQPGEEISNLPTQTLPDGTVVRMNYAPGAAAAVAGGTLPPSPDADNSVREAGGGSLRAKQARASRLRRLAKIEKRS